MLERLARTRPSALLVQMIAIGGAVAIMAAVPPSSGRMMLVPLSADSTHAMIAVAIDGGAALVGPGPLPGSFVIEGERAMLMRTMLRHGVALVAAPLTGCGE